MTTATLHSPTGGVNHVYTAQNIHLKNVVLGMDPVVTARNGNIIIEVTEMAGMFEQCGIQEPSEEERRKMAILVYDIMFKGKQAPEMIEDAACMMGVDNTPFFKRVFLTGYLIGRAHQEMEYKMREVLGVKNE